MRKVANFYIFINKKIICNITYIKIKYNYKKEVKNMEEKKIIEINEEKLKEVNGGKSSDSYTKKKKKRRSFDVGVITKYKYNKKEVSVEIISSYQKEKTFLWIGLNEYETYYHVRIVDSSTEFDVSESDLSDYYYGY